MSITAGMNAHGWRKSLKMLTFRITRPTSPGVRRYSKILPYERVQEGYWASI